MTFNWDDMDQTVNTNWNKTLAPLMITILYLKRELHLTKIRKKYVLVKLSSREDKFSLIGILIYT